MQCQSPQQIRKVLLGSVPTSDEEGFILAKDSGSEILTLLALCGADLKVFWTRSNICISDRITQPKLPLLFLTVFSKNVLIFGSEIWIFPSIRILGPSLHIRRNSVYRLPSWIWNIHQRYTHYLGLSYRRKNNYKTNARNKTKHKPEGFVPSQAHLENQMENSKDWFRNRRGPTLAFTPLLEKSNLAH